VDKAFLQVVQWWPLSEQFQPLYNHLKTKLTLPQIQCSAKKKYWVTAEDGNKE
jgi:hypothetical protein